MNKDIATLQVIAETLEQEPMASQRVLAENAGISIGLMNAILKRFVERGWIMLKNVNLRKFSYAVTAEGIAELPPAARTLPAAPLNLPINITKNSCLLLVRPKRKAKTKSGFLGTAISSFCLSMPVRS